MATTTQQKIEKALRILEGHNWYWMMEEAFCVPRNHAHGNMRAYVKLAASIGDRTTSQALRDLWTVTYKYTWKRIGKADYEAMKKELMGIIQPMTMAA